MGRKNDKLPCKTEEEYLVGSFIENIHEEC